jgi:hypothetical protein
VSSLCDTPDLADLACGLRPLKGLASVLTWASSPSGGGAPRELRAPCSRAVGRETLHARVAPREALLVDQVLPDRLRVAAAREGGIDQLTKRLARTRGPVQFRPRGAADAPESVDTPPEMVDLIDGRRTPPPWWPVFICPSVAGLGCPRGHSMKNVMLHGHGSRDTDMEALTATEAKNSSGAIHEKVMVKGGS